MELCYTVNLESDEPIMLIDKHIGFDETEGLGIMGSQFQKELLFLDTLKKKRIQIWINSPGGRVLDGYDICNAIMRTKTKVDTYCYGLAASIAGVIFLAGRTRYMTDYGIVMIHNPYDEDEEGNKTMSDSTQKIKESIVSMMSARIGMDAAKISELMDKETWLSASEAKELNICSIIESSAEMNVPRVRKEEGAVEMWNKFKPVFNKVKNFNNEKPKIMKDLSSILNLNEDAKESSFVAAVKNILNKSKEDEEKAAKMETEMNTMKQKMDEDAEKFKNLSDEYKKVKDAVDASEAKAKDAEASEAKAKATILVNDAVKVGKIANEAKGIESWTAKASSDYEGTKAMIDSIPLNKKAAVITEAVKTASTNDGIPAITPDNTAGYVAVMNAKKLVEAKARFK